jgi:hypothetical protein
MVSKLKERIDGFVLEVFIALRFFTAHAFDNLDVKSDRGVLFLAWWIFAKNKSEVKMEEISIFRDHQVLKVAISDCEQISSDGITSAGP